MKPSRSSVRLVRASRPPPAAVERLERRALLSAGDLDPTFGADPASGSWGTVTTDYAGPGNDFGRAVVAQPDGKYVVAGQVRSDAGSAEASAFAFARYNADGSLDATFGDGGRVLVNLGASAEARAVALAPGGKIVAAGWSSPAGDMSYQPLDFAAVRLNPDGSPDDTFDDDGRVTFDFGGGTEQVNDVVVAPDGRIYLAGRGGTSEPRGSGPAVAIRLLPDGALDLAFGGDGLAAIPPADPEGYAIAYGAALDAAGRLVIAGDPGVRLTWPTFFVARFRDDGTVDPAFGDDGMVTTAFPGRTSAARDVAILPGGAIVVAGQADAATGNAAAQWDVALAKYDNEGELDPSFGDGGRAVVGSPTAEEVLNTIAVGEGGAISVSARSGAFYDGRLMLARVDASGRPDPAVDGDGVAVTAAHWSEGRALAVGPGGTFVTAGEARRGFADYDFAVGRYSASGAPDATFGDGGRAVTNFDAMSPTEAADVAVMHDGRIVVVGRGPLDPELGWASLITRYTADGRPDPSFGAGGTVRWRYPSTSYTVLSAVAVAADGKVVVIPGSVHNAATGRRDWLVARFNADGTPDTSFGQGGVTVFPLGAGASGDARTLEIQPDGRILVGGGGGGGKSALARLLPSGALDPSFGTGGVVLTPVRSPGSGFATVTSIAFAPGGKIVAAGPTGSDFEPTSTFAVARYDSAGRPDPTFAGDGAAEINLLGSNMDVAVVVRPDGSMVVGTTAQGFGNGGGWTDKDFAVVEIPASGPRWNLWTDPPALVRVDFAGGHDTLHDLVLLPDETIVAVGTAAAGPEEGSQTTFALARFTPDLALDPTVGGGDGLVTTDVAGSNSRAVAAAVSPFGRLVIAGTAVVPLRATDFAVARYLMNDGSPIPAVAGAHVFYRGAPVNRLLPAGGAADDAAIATDKRPLLPAQTAAFRNVTSYTRGINGVMIDVVNPYGAALTAEDFTFRFADGRTGAWAAGPAPASVTVRHGAGVGGSDRVTLAWNDYAPGQSGTAVANGWLEVTLRANDNTRLAMPYTFRIGNLVGETGRGLAVDVVNGGWRVDALDAVATRGAQGPAARTSAFDFNRDGRVNAVDVAVVRAGQGRRLVPAVAPVVTAAAPLRQPAKRRDAYDLLG